MIKPDDRTRFQFDPFSLKRMSGSVLSRAIRAVGPTAGGAYDMGGAQRKKDEAALLALRPFSVGRICILLALRPLECGPYASFFANDQ